VLVPGRLYLFTDPGGQLVEDEIPRRFAGLPRAWAVQELRVFRAGLATAGVSQPVTGDPPLLVGGRGRSCDI
jgi:hypothetical protein